MTTVEHNIPVSVLYDDLLTLYSLSGTGSTPTHIVDYGGPFGEQLLWATEDIPNDPKYVLPQHCGSWMHLNTIRYADSDALRGTTS